jgi:hypothetical protein
MLDLVEHPRCALLEHARFIFVLITHTRYDYLS